MDRWGQSSDCLTNMLTATRLHILSEHGETSWTRDVRSSSRVPFAFLMLSFFVGLVFPCPVCVVIRFLPDVSGCWFVAVVTFGCRSLGCWCDSVGADCKWMLCFHVFVFSSCPASVCFRFSCMSLCYFKSCISRVLSCWTVSLECLSCQAVVLVYSVCTCLCCRPSVQLVYSYPVRDSVLSGEVVVP